MHNSISLNGTWQLTYSEDAPQQYTAASLDGRGMLPATVPAPVHRVLMDNGLLDDPNVGMNSLRARWVEEAFWIYRHTFEAPEAAADAQCRLVFDRLAMNATVWLNGQEVGKHANVHRPAAFDVTGKVRAGENLIVVQLTAGLQESLDKPSGDYAYDWYAKMTRRHWDRKPQYEVGWDWNPRLMNVGILGGVRLEWHDRPVLGQVTVFALPSDDYATADVVVRASVLGAGEGERKGILRARIAEAGAEVSAEVTLPAGETRREVRLSLASPKLWWPIGHGGQALYTVEVTLECEGETDTVTRRTGVRRVTMDQSAHPVVGRHCVLTVNGRPIFCKGGNWVPPDMLYSEVTPERYRALVDLATEANFNLLRVWGGAIFADEALLDACDEAGVLVWHDFLFACAKYPGDDPAFAAEVRREVTHAVREMAHHPSMAVWCGNNEVEWGDWDWGYDSQYRTHPHYAIFHHDIPKIVLEEDPSTAHWLSSPWSPDYRHPNDPLVGDQHPWKVSIFDGGGADFWQYRDFVDRFPNEGGVIGVSMPATLRQFLPENERRLFSPSWQHHDNPLAALSGTPGELGRAYQTVQLWTGLDSHAMSMEEYAFISGLLQAEGLSEYIGNYRRRMFSSASAIFWMYNDSWPVTHGWTIVDYYLRRKLAYHPVRRANQPVTVVVVAEGDTVAVHGVNDTPHEWVGELRYGVFGLGGGLPIDRMVAATLPANASTVLATFAKSEWEAAGLRDSGAFAIIRQGNNCVAQHRLFVERFGDLRFAPANVVAEPSGDDLVLSCDTFAWGVCLDADEGRPLADNCFDLIPGVPYVVPGAAVERVVRVANRDVFGVR